jgi:hypothetical protein
MGRLSDLFRRIGRPARESSVDGDEPEPGSWLSIGGVSIGPGGNQSDRDHDGIPDSQDSDSGDSGDSDGGDSGGDD